MRKKIPNLTFEKFAFFVFLLALALISAPQVLAQNIISDSGNILDIKASSTPTNSTFRFLPSTSANSFSLQGIANPANGESTVSIFEYLSSTSTFKMLDGVLDFNPTTNNIGIGISPTQKLHVAGNVRISGDIINDGNYGTGLVGLYSATRYQNVFAMGAAYRLAANGTAPGSMYGIAWTHSNIGGQSKAGLAHQALFMTNGVTQTAIGTGIWTLGGYTQTGTAVNTFSGNIGINTTVPQATLDVDGLIKMRSSNITTTSDVINKGYLDSALGGVFSSIDLAQYWKLSGSNLYPSSTAWNVGIGVVAPAEKLDVYGNIRMSNSGANQLQFTNANVKIYRNGNSMRIDSYDGWKFYDMQGSAERMRLTNLGNLGIGTTNPTFKLDVSGTGHFSDTLRVDNGLKYTGSNAIYFENIALKNNTTIPNGYIKLVTPIRTSHSQMFSIDITGYDYNVGKSIDFTISGYAYSGTDSVINLGFSNRSSFSRQVRVALEDRGDGYRVLVVTLGTSDGSGNCNDAWYFQKFGASVKLWGGPGTYTADQFTWVNGETSLATGYWQSSQLNNQVFDGQLGTITTFGNITSNSGVISMRGTGNNYFNGNVGIGTTLPNRRLDLGGGPTGRIYGIDTATSAVFTDSEVVPKKWIVDNFAPSVIVGSASLWATSSAGTYNVGLGNVGIGTTAPVKLLDIGSSVSTAAQYIRINSAAAYATGINFASAGTDKWWLYRPASSNDLRLYDGADRVTFQIGGNVGIGTIAPNQQLEITKNFRLPSTTGTTPYGVIYKDGNRFIHDFNYGLNGNGITTNGGNTFVGVNSGNLTMGSTAIASNQSSANTGVGYQALSANTTGYNNTAVGYRSLTSNTTGYYNTAVGYRSLTSNTTGYYNTANGYESLLSNTSGYSNTAYGHASLRNNSTGMENTATGYNTLYSNTSGYQNSAFGYTSLQSNTSGYGNTGNGYQALYSNTTGNYNVANGMYSLSGNTTGSYNTALGFAAGNQNADYSSRTTGNNGLYLGRESRASANGTDNEIVIGYNAIGKGSNTATYGNTSMTKHIFEAGNVGIGSTSPVAKLVVSGGNLFISDALISSSTPHAAITKTYLDSALSALASSTSYWTSNDGHIYNNNSGNVGIGTGLNYPLAKLQINQEAVFNTLTPGPAAYYGLHFGGQTTADYATGITWNGGTSGTQAGLYVQGSGSYGTKMYFATTNSYATGAQTRMMIDQSGNVGIGTTAPGAYKLYVQGPLYANGNVVAGGDAYVAGGDIYDASGDLHVLGEDNLYLKMDYNNDDADIRSIIFAKNTGLATAPTGTNELMRITETGNVGIGISNPSYLLHVKGEASFGNSVVHEVSAPVTSTDAVNRYYVDTNFAPLSSSFWTPNPNNPNHIYNTNSGYVGIGVSAPAQKLDVAGTINASSGFKVNNTATSGYYLRGNGTNYVASTIQASDVPTLNQNTSGYAGYLISEDNRSISPSELARNMMKFGFTSYKNDNSYPYADFLHFNSYADSSGGNDNLLVFNKRALGMRLYQEVFGSASPYTKYKDVVLAENTPAANYLTKYSTVGDEVTVAASSIYDNGTYVGIGTATPTSKLHVVGSSYLNGTIKTNLTGTGSRCLHVDASGVIGTMAGDCGTSTGGDNLGNGIASSNIALGNYWLSGDGGNEGVFVKADGKVGIGDSAPGNKLTISGDVGINGSSNSILFNLHTISASGRSYLNFQSDEAYGAHTYSIDSLYAVTSNPTLSGAILSLNPSGGGVSFGGSIVVPNAVYNADSSRWLSFGPSGDSLKVAGNLNTTAGTLKVSGTGNSWIMGKLGIGTTNPNSTAGMTIDTAATAPSILFRNAGSDKALISFRNGINFTMNSSIGAPVVPGNTGSYNIGIGSYTFYTGTGSSNIGIGVGAARSSSGNGNIAIGISAMDSTGAGSSNIAIGNSALYQGTSGAYNIAIGVNALNGSGIGNGNIAIGNRGQWTNSSNKLYIGDLNPGLTDLPLIYGDMTSTTTGAVGIKTTNLQSGMAMTVAGKVYADDFIYSSSDARLKHDIKNLSEIDYQKILKLRPVSFTYNKNNSKGFGFIAQELEKLYPEMVETNESDGMKSVTYDNLISPTIMAIQEQQKKIEEQETLIQILLDRVNKLENSTK